MNIKLTLIFLTAFHLASGSGLALEMIDGCQGEGCNCYNAYKEAVSGKKGKDFDVVTIRPFKLYKEADPKSPLLGSYKAGTKARPLKNLMVIASPGELIAEAENAKLGVKKGDKLDSQITEGEGAMRARHNGKWIAYDYSDLKLRESKSVEIQDWTLVSTGGVKGYTQDVPFELCLE